MKLGSFFKKTDIECRQDFAFLSHDVNCCVFVQLFDLAAVIFAIEVFSLDLTFASLLFAIISFVMMQNQ